MDSITFFGFVSIIFMLIAYIQEDKATIWIFIFASACLASSLYGWLAGTVPFGIVEIIWAGFAYRKWWMARTAAKNGNSH